MPVAGRAPAAGPAAPDPAAPDPTTAGPPATGAAVPDGSGPLAPVAAAAGAATALDEPVRCSSVIAFVGPSSNGSSGGGAPPRSADTDIDTDPDSTSDGSTTSGACCPAAPSATALALSWMRCPHLRHFMRTDRPAILSSPIWYLALQFSQMNFIGGPGRESLRIDDVFSLCACSQACSAP